MVTPQDIAEKGFRISFRGYNTEEVDDFLQEIYDSYIEIYEANQKLNETTGRLSDAVGQYKSMEDTLNDALNIAGMSADEIEESAHSKAAEILKNAELAANSIIAGAEQKIAAEQYRLENIKRETETYKAKIIELLNAQLCVLNEYPESASLSGVDSASDKDAHMWKKHRNSAKGKTFTKASADINDARKAKCAEESTKTPEKSEKSSENTDFSKTALFEPVKDDVKSDTNAEPNTEVEAKPKAKAVDNAPVVDTAKVEDTALENMGDTSVNLAADESNNESYYEMMKKQVFGNTESVRPKRDTSKLPFVSMNENGGYTVRK